MFETQRMVAGIPTNLKLLYATGTRSIMLLARCCLQTSIEPLYILWTLNPLSFCPKQFLFLDDCCVLSKRSPREIKKESVKLCSQCLKILWLLVAVIFFPFYQLIVIKWFLNSADNLCQGGLFLVSIKKKKTIFPPKIFANFAAVNIFY